MAEWFPFNTWTTIQQPILTVCPYCLAVVPKGEAAMVHVQWHIDNDWDPPQKPLNPNQQERIVKKQRRKAKKTKKVKGNGNT